jgi:hypothetical protein
MASLPRSRVLMRIASSMGDMKIFPSPIAPVDELAMIISMIFVTSFSSTTISTLVLGRRSTLIFDPPTVSAIPLCLPRPLTSYIVRLVYPAFANASLTVPNFSVLIIASIFFRCYSSVLCGYTHFLAILSFIEVTVSSRVFTRFLSSAISVDSSLTLLASSIV